MSARNSNVKIIAMVAIAWLFQMSFLFVPAGTLNWPEAWLYLTVFFSYVGVAVTLLKKNDPDGFKRRMSFARVRPVKGWDKIIMLSFAILFTALFLIAGFDAVRYQWSQTPLALKALGFVGFILSLTLNFLVIRENAYASKIVEIQKDGVHKVITTGPYSFVRHPMYVGYILLLHCLPLALGSLYALIPGSLMAILLIIRTHLEDKFLQKELKGYKEYTKKVKYRLLPGVW